jgi:hypothetical protein
MMLNPNPQPTPCAPAPGLECTNPEHDHTYSRDLAGELAGDPPQAHVGDELACNDCGRPTFYCKRTGTYWHTDPAAPACFLIGARS